MVENALNLNGVSKAYHNFRLNDISFNVPCGSIVGLIGENGAGKSTTIRTILGLSQKHSGTIELFGKKDIDFNDRNCIGTVFDGNNFPENYTPRTLGRFLSTIYTEWDDEQYTAFLERLSLPVNCKIRKLSKGMKMKLAIAAALSHHARLLVLDEATSGLDPIIREEILDMLLEFIGDENNSVLISSHITGDLEKIADYIVFIHNGKVVFNKSKDELRYKYGIVKCGEMQFKAMDKKDIIAYRKQDFEWQVLVSDRELAHKKYPQAVIDMATIDDIMLLYIKGEQP